ALEQDQRGKATVVVSMAFSPQADYLATGYTDGTVKVWDVKKKGKKLFSITVPRPQLLGVGFQPDAILVTVDKDGFLRNDKLLYGLDNKDYDLDNKDSAKLISEVQNLDSIFNDEKDCAKFQSDSRERTDWIKLADCMWKKTWME